MFHIRNNSATNRKYAISVKNEERKKVISALRGCAEMTFIDLYPDSLIIQLREVRLREPLLRGARESQPWEQTYANDVCV